jgi:hypothetical protein
MAAMKLAGTEKRRSTEQKNTVTMGVTATQDSTSEWRELGAQVNTRARIKENFGSCCIAFQPRKQITNAMFTR